MSYFVETDLNHFFVGYVLQGIYNRTFLLLYQSAKEKYTNKNLTLFLYFWYQCYITRRFQVTTLPYLFFTRNFWLCLIFNIANFIYNDHHTYEDYFYLLILFFIHPFWSIFIPLYIGMYYLFLKKKSKRIFLFFIFLVSL